MSRFLDENGLVTFWKKIFNSITTKVTKIYEDIPVAGGPLATPEMMEKYPNGIESGSALQDLLFNMFCEEKYPSKFSVNKPSITSKFNKPSVTVSNNGGTVEVGTQISIGAFNGYDPTNTPVSRTYTGFDYGYSTSAGGEVIPGNPPKVDVSSIILNSGTFRLTRTYKLFTGGTSPETTGDSHNINIPAENVIAQEGANTVTFTINGPGYKGTVASSPKYYAASNLKHTIEDHIISEQSEETVGEGSSAAQGSTTYTVNGRYKYFMGYSTKQNASDFDSESVRALTAKTGFITPNGETIIQDNNSAIKSDGNSIVIACPVKYELSSITNGVGADIKSNFSKSSEISINTGNITTDYTVYLYPISNGAVVEMKNIKLNVK